MQVVEAGSVIFVTLFVYDQNSNPVWYTAQGNYQGNGIWTGDLFQTNGPWFGTAPFNPGLVSRAKVGTLTFDDSPPNTVTHATLTYSVNGVVITKAI